MWGVDAAMERGTFPGVWPVEKHHRTYDFGFW